MDDFGVKYINKTDVNHLIQALKQDYEIEEDWEGTRYLGITLDWDYKKRKVHLSMPGYVERALARFGHLIPKILQHQPHKHTVPTYGATIQYAKDNDATNLLSKEEKKYIQQVLGTFLYYGRAVDSTMLTALSSIASNQAEPTKETMDNIKLFLDYAASHQDAILTYQASDMVLIVHSDSSYLSKPTAQSRAEGHFFMSSGVANPHNNGAVLNIAQLIKSVMSSAAEAELGALYINACEAVPMQQLLAEMGQTQPSTPIQTDNSTACGVVNNNIQPWRTKDKRNGYEISLVARPQSAKPIPFLLGPRKRQLRRLLDKEPLCGAPHSKTSYNINTTEHRYSPASITTSQSNSISCQSSMSTAKRQNKKL